MSAKVAAIKRSSAGAEGEKAPIEEPEISEEEAAKLNAITKDIQRAELILERRAQAVLTPVYAKRREVLKQIARFWPVALMNHSLVALHAQHTTDKLALSYLEDLWVVRNEKEPKVFAIEFYFKENPFFSDSVLKKTYKYIPSPASATEQPDADGITESMLEFSWERDVEVQATPINWKEDAKNLSKLYPMKTDAEDEDDVSEWGTFFNWFGATKDPLDLGVVIANEIFPDAIDFFTNSADDDDDLTDEDEEDEEEEEEIDLEKPRAKKPKRA